MQQTETEVTEEPTREEPAERIQDYIRALGYKPEPEMVLRVIGMLAKGSKLLPGSTRNARRLARKRPKRMRILRGHVGARA